MHEVNSYRCRRQPMYGRDLVLTLLSLCRHDCRKAPWLWSGALACQLLQNGVRPEEGGAGSLALSNILVSYQGRAAAMDDTIRR